MFPIMGAGNPTGYNLTRSLRFRASATAYLNRTPASTGSLTTWTYSVWTKRGAIGADRNLLMARTAAQNYTGLFFSGDNLWLDWWVSGSAKARIQTTQVFRDPSAWYHIVCTIDSTNATAANRVRLYVNGTIISAFTLQTLPALNDQTIINQSGIATWISSDPAYPATAYYDGEMAEVNFIDGQALTPSSFGSTNALTGVWQPARYTGTYGTNGFYLPFTDNSALTTSSNVGLGKDFSGNGNYWTTNNISITAGVTYDSMTDVPTLTSATAANFAVWNAVKLQGNSASDGNLKATTAAGGPPYPAGYGVRSTIGTPTSGKWYAEITPLNTDSSDGIGITDINTWNTDVNTSGNNTVYYRASGTKYVNGTNNVAYGSSYVANDVIGVAVDIGAGTVTFYKNNVSQGAITLPSSTASYCFLVTNGNAAATSFAGNFGQRPFSYTAPTGFVALNTFNLPTSTIVKGNTVMDATTYTGAGGTQSITNAAGFKPDFVWVKARAGGNNHVLFDSVRGFGSGKDLSSNLTGGENAASSSLYGFVSTANSNGFTCAAGTDPTYSNDLVNRSASSYIGWQWQAGQGSSSSNTSGSITSTVSVNASAGFSVVTYSGNSTNSTVGHGLGVAPSMIFIKGRTNTSDWRVYHASVALPNVLNLNTTSAAGSDPAAFTSTSPTSSVFSIGSGAGVNSSGNTYVAYCWTPIAGFSAFGSLTGNGSADGVFVYTGFQPKFVMLKSTSTGGWVMMDTARNPYNVEQNYLYGNSGAVEAGGNPVIDALSNGFKIRTTWTDINPSGTSVIYAAFASNPFKNSLAQ